MTFKLLNVLNVKTLEESRLNLTLVKQPWTKRSRYFQWSVEKGWLPLFFFF